MLEILNRFCVPDADDACSDAISRKFWQKSPPLSGTRHQTATWRREFSHKRMHRRSHTNIRTSVVPCKAPLNANSCSVRRPITHIVSI